MLAVKQEGDALISLISDLFNLYEAWVTALLDVAENN